MPKRYLGRAVAVGFVLAWLATIPSLGAGSRRASHLAVAQPAPTATPRVDLSAFLFGDPVTCESRLRLEPLPTAVAVGERITVTATVDMSCPDSLADAAVLVFAGSTEPGAQPGIEAGIDRLAGALDRIPDTPLAVVDAAAADAPLVWVDTPMGRKAALDAVAARPVGLYLDGEAWAARLKAASAALAALPPTRRPMLVIVDGRRPRLFVPLARSQVEASANAVRDAAGVVVLLDMSLDGWLAAVGRTLPPAGVIGFDPHAARDAGIVRLGVQGIVDRLGGVIDVALLEIDWTTDELRVVDGSAAPPPVFDGHGMVQWRSGRADRELSMKGRVVLTGRAVGRGTVAVSFEADRAGEAIAAARSTGVVCVQARGAGGAATCTPEHTSTVIQSATSTPPPRATSSPGVRATPTRPPRPTASPRVGPTNLRRWRLWLPAAWRADAAVRLP
ncbi:MAG: hypothetical protein ABI780_03730 [Ardenticatenales bacterium]